MTVNQQQWLAQVKEEIIEPERPICDPHHHLWDFETSTYLLPELLQDCASGHNIVSTVFVECSSMFRADGAEAMKPLGETEFVNGIAAMSASGNYGDCRVGAGIVSHADLMLGHAVGEVLDEHLRLSDRFRGIRHAAGWDKSTQIDNSHSKPIRSILLDDRFRQGFSELEQRGLSFDAWLYHPQIPELTDLARTFPNVTIILDHFGGPLGIGPYAGRGDEIFQQWCIDTAELAKCTNVYAKLGGMAMPINGFGWHSRDTPASSDELVAATGRYYDKAIELFGPERCMFESNFPVDKRSCSYPVLWNACKKMTSDMSAADKQRLFHDTAARAYRLA